MVTHTQEHSADGKLRSTRETHMRARVVDGELRVLTPKAALRSLQRMVREASPGGVSMVDELIAERRAEARREDGE